MACTRCHHFGLFNSPFSFSFGLSGLRELETTVRKSTKEFRRGGADRRYPSVQSLTEFMGILKKYPDYFSEERAQFAFLSKRGIIGYYCHLGYRRPAMFSEIKLESLEDKFWFSGVFKVFLICLNCQTKWIISPTSKIKLLKRGVAFWMKFPNPTKNLSNPPPLVLQYANRINQTRETTSSLRT